MPPRLRYKARLKGLVAEHSLLHSRKRIGFTTFTDAEMKAFAPVIRPLVRTIPGVRPRISVYRIAYRANRWHDRRGKRGTDEGVDHTCHAAAVRLCPPLARWRSRYVGRSLHDASRYPVRRHTLAQRYAEGYHLGADRRLRHA